MEPLTGTVPLSVLFDRMAGPDGARDQDFVRAFTEWLHHKAAHLEFDLVEHYALEDVVATFHMREAVKLVVTGYPPQPYVGSVTLEIGEADFVRLMTTVRSDPRPAGEAYEFCTLDYYDAGGRVAITAGPYVGQMGALQVCATVGSKRQVRVRLDGGPRVIVAADDVEQLEG